VTSSPGSPDGAAAAAPTGTEATRGERFRAPHRRTSSGPRVREKVVVGAYRAGSWVLGRLPFGPTVRVGGWIAIAVYVAWPEKRRYVRANAARILDAPVDDRRVDALARAVFRNQVRWVIEGMHLARMTNAEHVALFDARAADTLHRAWETSNGLILAGLHIGNGEVAAAALAGRGWPTHVLADDTAYDELFERFTAQRRAWGVEVIRWRNLREVYRVLRSHEILGLLVDWGYRPDGQPVRFMGHWTTLPAGPAFLAARTGATILPFWTRRLPDGRVDGEVGEPIVVASTEPAEIARATQALADALEVGVRAAPEQWCVFKPMWPDDPAEEALLAARAAEVLAEAGATSLAGAPGRPPVGTPGRPPVEAPGEPPAEAAATSLAGAPGRPPSGAPGRSPAGAPGGPPAEAPRGVPDASPTEAAP
jgi:phosphatidylinositol dimannoside acyltransferase